MENGKKAELHIGSLEHPKSHPKSGKHSAGPQDLKTSFRGYLLGKTFCLETEGNEETSSEIGGTSAGFQVSASPSWW